MSRWMALIGTVLLAGALAACGAHGGDPVAGQQIPAGATRSEQPDGAGADRSGTADGSEGSGPDGSASQESGSGQGGGSGSGDDNARKVGLPKSIRIPEIGEAVFKDAVIRACRSPNGATDCLTVTYTRVDDPDKCGNVEWESDPPKESLGDGEAIVQRGATIAATVFTCPPPDSGTTEPPITTDAPETTPEPGSAPETAAP